MGCAILAASQKGEVPIDMDDDKVWNVLLLQLVKRGRGQLMWMMIRCGMCYTCSKSKGGGAN